jgi:hypothetical protein
LHGVVELQVNTPAEVTLKVPLPSLLKPPLVEIVTVQSVRESGMATGVTFSCDAGRAACAPRFRLATKKIVTAMAPVLIREFILPCFH